jgi:hypothetical protein
MKWKLSIFFWRVQCTCTRYHNQKKYGARRLKANIYAIKMTREKKKERKQTPQQRTMHTGTKYKQPLSLQQLLIDNKQQTTT